MATRHPHLFRRGAIYYWRLRLPALLAGILRRSHVCRSLQTPEPAVARRLAKRLSIEVAALTDRLERLAVARRPLPSPSDLNKILLDLFYDVIQKGEIERLSRPRWVNPLFPPDEATGAKAPAGPASKAESLRASLRMNDFTTARQAVEPMLKERRLAVPDAESHDYRVFLRNAMLTLAAAFDVETELEQGKLPTIQHPLFPRQATDALSPLHQSARHARMTISEAANAFIADKVQERSLRAATANEQRAISNLFIALMGNLTCLNVTRKDARDYRSLLLDLPANYGRGRYQKMEPKDCIATRKAIQQQLEQMADPVRVGLWSLTRADAEKAAVPLGRGTINKHLDFFTGLFAWLGKTYFPDLRNPFEGQRFRASQVEADEEVRLPWTVEQLAALFATPVWTGCQDENGRGVPGSRVFEDHRFWVPLLGLFTGLREGEICRLAVADVQRNEGTGDLTLVLDHGPARETRRKGLNLKTRQSARVVPVHDELIRVGFARYVDAVRAAGHDRLFPVLQPTTARQSFAIQFTKWFNRYRKEQGLATRWLDFYALRHTFASAIDPAGLHDRKMKQRVLGHKTGLDTLDGYWHLDPATIRPLVNSATYAGLDLSPLYPENQPHREFLFHDGSRAEGRRKAAAARKPRGRRLREAPA